MKALTKVLIITGVLLLTNAVTHFVTKSHTERQFKDSIVTVHDTLTIYNPVPDTTFITSYIKVPIYHHDTISLQTVVTQNDTVFISLPREAKQFSGSVSDCTYSVSISGFSPSLDSLTITNSRSYIPVTEYKNPKFSFNLYGSVDYATFAKQVGAIDLGIEAPVNLGRVTVTPRGYFSVFDKDVFVGAEISYNLFKSPF